MKIGFVNLDQPVFRNCLPPMSIATSPLGYVRFHGRNYKDWFRKEAGRDDRYNYLYSPEELNEWVKRIDELKKNANEVFVVTNNHFQGQAVCNALQLQSLLGISCPPIPESLKKAFPMLSTLEGNNLQPVSGRDQ